MTEYTVIEWAASIVCTLFLMRGVIAFVKDDLKVGKSKNDRP